MGTPGVKVEIDIEKEKNWCHSKIQQTKIKRSEFIKHLMKDYCISYNNALTKVKTIPELRDLCNSHFRVIDETMSSEAKLRLLECVDGGNYTDREICVIFKITPYAFKKLMKRVLRDGIPETIIRLRKEVQEKYNSHISYTQSILTQIFGDLDDLPSVETVIKCLKGMLKSGFVKIEKREWLKMMIREFMIRKFIKNVDSKLENSDSIDDLEEVMREVF